MFNIKKFNIKKFNIKSFNIKKFDVKCPNIKNLLFYIIFFSIMFSASSFVMISLKGSIEKKLSNFYSKQLLEKLEEIKSAEQLDTKGPLRMFKHLAPEKIDEIVAELKSRIDLYEKNNKISNGRFSQTEDIDEATNGCNCVYTDVGWWIGQEQEEQERRDAFAPYQVTAEILKKCDKNAIFEHCLPAGRGVEVTDAVMDGPHSVIFDQAENRMHTEKALMVLIMA